MDVMTGWVKPPTAIGGLDHLGTQGPCLLIYAQLLPGITNVTDRARYYSLYPWIVWSFEGRFPDADAERFIELFRRADCLFTLISERHARTTDNDPERHGAAMVGRNTLLPALDRLQRGEQLKLSSYTDRDSEHRYFKNRLGGLGQYYAGALAQLELMDPSAKPWIKFTIERGQPLAEAVDSTVPGDLFWATVEADAVTLEALDSLSSFCACSIGRGAAEHEALVDIFFDRHEVYGAMGVQRRRTLALILHLADALHHDGGADLTEDIFRAAVYAGTLPGSTHWVVPEPLHATLHAWALYERNDLLSVAMQSVFAICLEAMQSLDSTADLDFRSVEAFALSLSKAQEVNAACASLGAAKFRELVVALRAGGPALSAWEDAGHEIQLVKSLVEGIGNGGDLTELLQLVLRAIAMIEVRRDKDSRPYGVLPIGEEELTDSPINLASFAARCVKWRDLPLQEVVEELFAWCLHTHLRVALRKLRQSSQSTFRFRPTERGLQVVDFIPPPAKTTPRFRQAVQVLRDIGALTRDGEIPGKPTTPSALGLALLEAHCG